jgi:hypothetical protein
MAVMHFAMFFFSAAVPSVRPCSGAGKQAKNRLFPALGKFGDRKKR